MNYKIIFLKLYFNFFLQYFIFYGYLHASCEDLFLNFNTYKEHFHDTPFHSEIKTQFLSLLMP